MYYADRFPGILDWKSDYIAKECKFKKRLRDESLDFLKMYEKHLKHTPCSCLEKICKSFDQEYIFRCKVTDDVIKEKKPNPKYIFLID